MDRSQVEATGSKLKMKNKGRHLHIFQRSHRRLLRPKMARLVAGNFSILDFFDKNAFDIDPRQGFLCLGFLTYAAWDFASDARGYSYGGVAELDCDNWAVRVGRITPPKDPNQLPVDFTVRVLGYRNHEDIGRFADAIAAFEINPQENATTCPGFNYGSNNANAPDLCWVRKLNVKVHRRVL